MSSLFDKNNQQNIEQKVTITIYTDGACSGNPGPGGYAAILVARKTDGTIAKEREVVGGDPDTTNNRMEIMAAIEGLRALTTPSIVTIVTDSEYVYKTMVDNWKKKKNKDLWETLIELCDHHKVSWEWTKGHAGHEYNEKCDKLAVEQRDIFAQSSDKA